MKLIEIRESYENGEITRDDLFVRMRQQYGVLSDLSSLLRGTGVASVEVNDTGVVLTSRPHGVKIKCDPTDKGIPPIVAINLHEYEKEDSAMLLKLVDDGMTFLDIGANLGWYGLHVAKIYPNSRVFAFEPIKRTYGFLRDNIQINKLENISAFSYGLFSESEERIFYADPEILGAASTSPTAGDQGIEHRCLVRKMDEVLADFHSGADFLKIDVEGAELFVLEGGIETIRTSKPIIFAEMLRKHAANFNYHPNDIIELLAGENYRCFYSRNGKLIEFFRMDEQTEEKNFFFLHKEKHSDKIITFSGVRENSTKGWRAPLFSERPGGFFE